MTEKEELLQRMLQERLKLLAGKKLTPQEKEIVNEGEKAIQEMEEGARAKVEAYLNLMAEKDLDAGTAAYREGFKDAVRLMKRICRIWREDTDDNSK